MSQLKPVVYIISIALVFFGPAPISSAIDSNPSVLLNSEIESLIKALSHQESSSKNEKAAYVIAIVHNREVQIKLLSQTKKAFENNQDLKIQGRTVSVVLIPFSDAVKLQDKLGKKKPNAVYIPSGNDKSIRVILSVTRRMHILSITNVPDFVHWKGVTLGVDSSKGGNPKIMVNLASCQNEKVEFDQKLLEKAEVFF
ncbi:MAG: DUF4154 domain-containing protein [Deltaproteobacteria bacterium]|nr:DUF4154 domain-containing protein [Deltaproteobacteria bacterium]MBW1871546.1 DUF4154 domain-containing protein [Deltaproteobacteria bacterium]